jgi:hypothetical protein
MVAAEAGTAVETIYAGVGSKAQLLSQAIDAALVGDDAPLPFVARTEFTGLGSGRPAARLAAAAQLVAATHARSVRLLRALQEAAASDSLAAQRWEKYERDRRDVVALGLSMLTSDQVSAEVVDGVWAVCGPEVFAKLVLDRGWPVVAYEAWLVEVVQPLIGVRRRRVDASTDGG